MSKLGPLDHIDYKNILKHWIEFQLVDEQGKPLVNMPYRLKIKGRRYAAPSSHFVYRCSTTGG
ncbi:hypothetical protein [Photorhabdus heterorhabditis]|uniref:hypothetical protein n=1 Tax=Photorhabdus heterorhabditis TaxID=880156 RepID=UPI0020B83D80|nr:hypothetical protein [Photorhabdus heterorhabditis]